MKFIKLHAGDVAREYWFNVAYIIHMTATLHKESLMKTQITFAVRDYENRTQTDPWTLNVQETPDQIIALIDRATALVDMLET